MLPLSHCLYVTPTLIGGPASFHASARCFRCTAVRMNRPATSLACFSTGTFFCAATWLGFAGVSGVETSGFAVLRKKTSRNVTIPATSTRAEIHGAMRAKRRALFRRAGYADPHSEYTRKSAADEKTGASRQTPHGAR